jgi:CRP-like cAMP-binding protein
MLAIELIGGRDVAAGRAEVSRMEPAKGVDDGSGHSHEIDLGPIRIVAAKEHIFCEGDIASHVYVVEAGNVAVYHMLPDGRRQVLDFAYPGDMIGLGAIGEHAVSAQASCRTRIRCIPSAALFEAASRNPTMTKRYIRAMQRELQAAHDLLFTISQRSATERVASFLLALSRRNAQRGENPHEVVLPMTRTDIADFLGLTIETVSRTLTRLRTLGHITIEQCILITISDERGLAELAAGRDA